MMAIASSFEVATAIGEVPDCVWSSDELAVIFAIPEDAGENTPEELTWPFVAVHVTAELYAPVPVTVAVQEDVCVIKIALGEQATETDVIVGGKMTDTVIDPEMLVSCADVAVMVTLPAVPGAVKSPDELIVPALAVHVTVEL
jgi:hypothetical protein